MLNVGAILKNRSEMDQTAQQDLDEYPTRDLMKIVENGQRTSGLSKHASI